MTRVDLIPAVDYRAMVDRVRLDAARRNAAAAKQNARPAPVCVDHGTPMKYNPKSGYWFCTRKAEDGDWCDYETRG